MARRRLVREGRNVTVFAKGELFNVLLEAVLPLVRRELGVKLIALNASGGLPLAPPAEGKEKEAL